MKKYAEKSLNENIMKGMIRMRTVMSFEEVAEVVVFEGASAPDLIMVQNRVSSSSIIPAFEDTDYPHFEFFRELLCCGLKVMPRMASILINQVELFTPEDNHGHCHFKATTPEAYKEYYEKIATIWRERKEKYLYGIAQGDIDGGMHWFLFKGNLSDAQVEEIVSQFLNIDGVECHPSPYDCTGQYFSDAIEIVRSPFHTLVKQSYSYDV